MVRDLRWKRRGPFGPLWLLVVGVAGVVVHTATGTSNVGEISYLVPLGIGSVLAWIGAHRRVGSARTPWAFLAFGLTVSALGDLVFAAYGWTGRTVGDASLGDPLWLMSYVALVAGIATIDRTSDRAFDVDAAIDSLVAGVVMSFLVWELVIAELVADSSAMLTSRLLWASYPILDVICLALLVHLMAHKVRGWSTGLVLLSLGVLAWLLADLVYATGDGAENRALDLAWMLGPLLVGAASCWTSGSLAPEGAEAPDRKPVGSRIWLVLWPLLVPSAFELRSYASGEDLNPAGPMLATAALLVLASIRVQRLVQAARRAHDVMEARQRYFGSLAANSVDAGLVIGSDSEVRSAFGNVGSLLGLGDDEVVGMDASAALRAGDPDDLARLLDAALEQPGRVVEADLAVDRSDGGIGWLAVRAINLFDEPAVAGIALNLHDVTEAKRYQTELEHRSLHDGLTDLANHSLFMDRLGQALNRRDRTKVHPTVVALDVDGFKSVNDRFGHAAGDVLLRQIADRLSSTVRQSDTLGRLGGDEFVVLLEDNHLEADEARTTAERILQAMSIPFEFEGQLIAVSASLGLASAEGSATPEQVLRKADIAMYRAKRAGKARIEVYDHAMGTEADEAAQIEHDLRHALRTDQLELHYQPVVELEGGRIVGFEALLRWRHPRLGLILPDRFIPAMEESGLIESVGRWVLRTACTAAAGWPIPPGGDGPLTVAVNVSGRQLGSDGIVDDVADALATSGIDPSTLVLEMTETALVADPLGGARRLEQLHGLGLKLAIDDFGTGYSSLNYLRLFPVDILKVDRSFVETITDEVALPPIVRGLLELGHTLELEIIAEGIEEPAQRAGLTAERCSLGQGYLFSRPIPAADVAHLLDSSGGHLPGVALAPAEPDPPGPALPADAPDAHRRR